MDIYPRVLELHFYITSFYPTISVKIEKSVDGYSLTSGLFGDRDSFNVLFVGNNNYLTSLGNIVNSDIYNAIKEAITVVMMEEEVIKKLIMRIRFEFSGVVFKIRDVGMGEYELTFSFGDNDYIYIEYSTGGKFDVVTKHRSTDSKLALARIMIHAATIPNQ
jgi:hypothetical protein